MAAAEALGATGAPAAEGPLIAALGRGEPSAWPAIAAALGLVGTAEAVAPLRAMAGRFPFDLPLRRSARQAIAEIQSRLTGATPGQLALASGEAGQLSLAEERGEGRVSITDGAPADPEADGEVQWPTDATTAGDVGAEGEPTPRDPESIPRRPRLRDDG